MMMALCLLLGLLPAFTPAQAENPGQILAQLSQTEREMLEVQSELGELQQQSEELEEELKGHQDKLDHAQSVVDSRSDRVRQLLRLAYLLNRRGFARILFSAEDPTDLRRRSHYLITLLAHTDTLVETFRSELDARRAALAQVQTRQEELDTLTLSAEGRMKALEQERAQRQALLTQARASSATMDQALAQTMAAQRSLSIEPAPASTQQTAPTTSFRDLQGRLPRPVSQSTQLKGFGNGNRGVDLLAPAYTTVRVVADGVVVRGAHIQGMGMTIIVDHGGGYQTVYSHLGQSKVRVGQQLYAGDYIGVVGETGVVDTRGPRVHFEVRYRNTPQNPADWLRS